MTRQVSGVSPGPDEYALANDWEQARMRLRSLEAAYDPTTVRRLDALGVEAGWHCLEVGAGAGSIARRLAARTGPQGRVVAADLDVRLLDSLAHEPNVDVRAHDLRSDPLPESAFDLIHARLVLSHIPEREQILDRLVAALRPGGWILLEESDDVTLSGIDLDLHRTVMTTHLAALEAAGFAGRWGTRVPYLLQERGLVDIGAVSETPLHRGGSLELEWLRLTCVQLGGPAGDRVVAPEVLQAWNDLLDQPDQWLVSLGLVGAWGRRPH